MPTNDVQKTEPTEPTKPATPIDRAYLTANYASLVAELIAEGGAIERARIQAIHSAAIPGCEAVIAGLMWDPIKNETDALRAVVAHMQTARSDALTRFVAEAPPAAPPSGTDAHGVVGVSSDVFMTSVQAYRTLKNVSLTAAMSHVIKTEPQAYAAYMAAKTNKEVI
jgi:hypothetical protein